MSNTQEFEKKTKELIDGLKSVCANYGLGNDGNEFKIITQVFLYKFLNDKFVYEVKQIDEAGLIHTWDETFEHWFAFPISEAPKTVKLIS